MSVAPPSAIEQRLSALVPRVRALRISRGVCWLILAMLSATCAVLLLDAAFLLPAWARGLFLSGWVTAVGVLTWRWVLVPWRAEIPLTDVARELEKQLPELGERLHEAVSNASVGSSSTVRAAVAEDTVRRTKSVDLAQAIPLHQAARHVAVAVVAGVAVVAAVAFVPGSSDRVRRIAMPWHRHAPAAWRVIVRSGEQVIRRGEPITLSAYAERIGNGVSEPPDAMLIVRQSPDAPEVHTAMTANGGAFHITLPAVAADFEYCVEIGGNRSDWYRVTALDAVELTTGTRVEIVPPSYTQQPKRILTAISAIDGLQFSTVNFQLRFSHPTAAAHLEWRREGAAKFEVLSLDLAPDRQSATGVFPLTTSGVLRLVFVREVEGKKLRTNTAITVRVARDEPPTFEEVRGLTVRPRSAKPNSRVPITFVVRDDLSVSGAVLEYVVGPDDSQPLVVPIVLSGAGTTRATGRHDFDLTGKGNVGETVRFRIRVTDNRTLDEPRLTPQDASFPSDGWSALKLDATALPLDQQDIVCQRDALHDALSVSISQLKTAASEADALHTAVAGSANLTVDQSVRLNNAREKVHEATTHLQSAAREAALTPELRPLAADLRAIIEQPLKTAADALRTAETDDPAVRKNALAAASQQLADAGSTLAEIESRNGKVANDRIDRARITALANAQSALAETTPKKTPDLIDRQQELLARLAALTSGSDSLRLAVDAAKGEEVRRLTAALRELAAMLRELDTAARQTATETRSSLVSAITRDQDTLAKRATVLLGKLETPARLAGVALPAADDFRRVAALVAAGRTVDALAELEKLALALEHLATAFDKWHAERADPKFAARQLALWQDDLLDRLRAAAKAGGFNKLPDDAKTTLRNEQKTLHTAVLALPLPPDEGVKTIHTNAELRTRLANECLARDGTGAEDAMKLAIDALIRLFERTPTVAERLAKSLREFERLRPDLEATSNAVELVLMSYDRKPPDAVTSAAVAKKVAIQVPRQRKLITAIAALDLPGLSARQARVVNALKTAVADLQVGSPLDVQASQLRVRREFDRLRLVLEGHPSPDAKAEELHHRLAALVDSLGPNLTKQQLEPALPVLQDVQRQLGLVVASEAPAILNDARVALQSAEVAFRDATPAEVLARMRTAVDALGKLADQLNGFESPLTRVKRLATWRQLAAEKPKEVLTADESLRQLGREADELTATRVGPAGQTLKKRALELYAKIRAKTDPDRIGTDLKTLATTLDELAARMADRADLATSVGRPTPLPPPDTDQFLPSKSLADDLRELAKQQRAIHTQITTLAAELANRLRPTAENPFATLEAKQRAILTDALTLAKQLGPGPATNAANAATQVAHRLRVAQVSSAKEAAEQAANFFRQLATTGASKPWGKRAEELVTRQVALISELAAAADSPGAATAQQNARTEELARRASAFAEQLERAARTFGPNDATGLAFTASAQFARDAEKQLLDAAEKAAEGNSDAAEKHRGAADAFLRMAAEKFAGAAPPAPPAGVSTATGLALRSAESSMRAAMDAITGRNVAAMQRAMHAAARALREAAESVGK